MHKAQLVVLAAGEGKRFGSAKQIALFNGIPMLSHVVSLAVAAGFKPWVALGAHQQRVKNQCSTALAKAELVIVDDWQSGLSVSIGAVIRKLMSLGNAQGGVFILLGDQPWITTVQIQEMECLVKQNPGKIVAADYSGRGGVPAFFPACYLEKLANLSGDSGAKQLIADSPHVLMALGDAVKDVDVPNDLKA